MDVEKLSSSLHVKEALRHLGVDGGGVSILASKMKLHFFYIRALHVGGANILKQDALSIGADLAVPKGTVLATSSHVDAILIANTRQLQELSRKELAQPFGLKRLALKLQAFLKAHQPAAAKIMGIINANDDSFYASSRFKNEAALHVSAKMIEEGADIIDIGGVSSRPGSDRVSVADELERVTPIIDLLYEQKFYDKTILSIDSYTPEVVKYALDKGFHIVNDITGLSDDDICKLVAEYKASAVIMHMQGTPQTMQANPSYDAVVSEVNAFFEARIKKAKQFNIEKLILDVGIGFGKRLEDNIALIAQLEHFLTLGYPLLVGASRKSMIDALSTSATADRLAGSLALHVKAIDNGAEIIRVHDVKEHLQALKIWQALQ
ncbi:MAG: dihydropteroate synthase [Campylobacterota bacterium]|nr:dihydropteroate synthase [Campylobacterota bacterium]